VSIPLVVDAPAATLIRSNLLNGYGIVQRARRDLLFSRAPNEPVLVAVTDALQKYASTPVSYQWRLNTHPDNTVMTAGDTFSFHTPSGAALRGMATAPAPRSVTPTTFTNGFEPAGYHVGVESGDAALQKSTVLDHLAVMTLSPAGAAAPTFTRLTTTGGSAVRVNFAGGSAIVASKTHGASMLASGATVSTNGELAKVTLDRGETTLAAGTTLRAAGRDYVVVTGSAATVVVSGAKVIATGPAGNSYRVYAPQSVASVEVNGAPVASCRVGNELSFPCAA
jgi:hypothetical protein